MSRYIVDIETDGLLDTCTTCWIIYFLDLDAKTLKYFLPFKGEDGWKEMLANASLVVGHNFKGFDIPALEKIYGFVMPRSVNIHDTFIMSSVLDYRRFGNDGHSMERWGEFLGQPKVQHEDWTQYSEEMRIRCREDVKLNYEIYNTLLEELNKIAVHKPTIKDYLRAEHYVAEWCAKAEVHGWPFDVENATKLFEKMSLELDAARERIMPLLGMKAVAVDKKKGEVEAKSPRYTRQGFYDAHTAKWFNIINFSGLDEDRLVDGEYCRVEFEPLDLDSVTDVKIFLFRHNWEPTEWNTKRVLNEKTKRYEIVKTSPKITEDSLEVMEGNGKIYCDFLTTKSRYGILKTWLEAVDDEGNLHGSCFTIGTPSMRSRHSIIVNVPTVDSTWGKEMRSLFRCKPGWKMVGCDSSGNQARGLAHYLKNPEFVDLLLNGDIHQYNANILTSVLKGMGVEHTVPRSVAKRILYAFLFGASGAKLWSYVFGNLNVANGNKLKAGFLKAVPGFAELIEQLENIYGSTKKFGDGYIPSLVGNRIYVDSFHKLLVYLLQSCEKITCSTAVMLTMQELEKQNIPYIPLIMMHDEEDFMVPEELAVDAAAIGKKAFKEGPKIYGIEIMDGESKIGDNWYEVH